MRVPARDLHAGILEVAPHVGLATLRIGGAPRPDQRLQVGGTGSAHKPVRPAFGTTLSHGRYFIVNYQCSTSQGGRLFNVKMVGYLGSPSYLVNRATG